MSAPHLAQTQIDRIVARGELAGAVALAWRDGAVATEIVSGWADVGAAKPMRRDTLFRIASLTKPVTSVAALMLYDEGRFELDDAVTEWAPELSSMRVLHAPGGPLEDAAPAERPITFGDLLTHRSGLSYGGLQSGELGRAYRAALGPDIDSPCSRDEWIAGLGRLPLVAQPGRGFHYGVSTDLLGLLLERMEDASLEDILRRRIFAPLGMVDTTFIPTTQLRARAARMYGFDAQDRLEARDSHPPHEPAFFAERPPGTTFMSGSGGLWSTADDYLRFARLFVEEGAVDGVRLLKLGTLRRLTANFLSDDQIAAARTLGAPVFSGHGFGLGVAVVLEPEKASTIPCKGGLGAVGWPGAYGGWWRADPTDGSVLVFLAHNALDFDKLARGVGLGVYSAVEAFQAAEDNGRRYS